MALGTSPCITAGVAVACAAAIAVTPVTPPLPEVTVPAIQLTAGADPITALEDVVQTASADAWALFDDWSSAPFPVLQQVIVNQIGYLESFPRDATTIPGQIWDNLQAAAAAPFAPDTATFLQYQQEIFGRLTDHLLFWHLAASPASGVLVGALGPVASPILALDNSVQQIADALTGANPNPVAAFDDLINVPAALLGAFLYGYGDIDLVPLVSALGVGPLPGGLSINSLDLGGLLSPGGSLFNALSFEGSGVGPDGAPFTYLLPGSPDGPIGSLVEVSQVIAQAIGWEGTGNPLAGLLDLPAAFGADVPMALTGLPAELSALPIDVLASLF